MFIGRGRYSIGTVARVLLRVWLPYLVMIAGSSLLPTASYAHPVAQGAIRITVQDHTLMLLMNASLEQVTVERTFTSTSVSPQSVSDQWSAHAAYILNHLKVTHANLELTGTLDPTQPIRREKSFIVIPFIYPLPQDADISRVSLWQDLLNEFAFAPGNPWEATFVVTQSGSTPTTSSGETQLLAPRQRLNLVAASNSGANAKERAEDGLPLFEQFARHGIRHIFEGYDHLLFACALVLGARAVWDVAKIIAAFTFAHSCTLTLCALDIIRIPSSIVEPLIALSIVVAAISNLVSAPDRRLGRSLGVALFFGLFHGLGFAGGLVAAMEGLSASTFWLALLGFSLGVEIGHQCVVIPVFMVLGAARHYDLQTGTRWTPLVQRTLGALIAAGGTFFLYGALSTALALQT